MKLLLLATSFLISCSHFDYDLDSKKQEGGPSKEEAFAPASALELEDLGLSDEELEEGYKNWMSRKKKYEAPKKETLHPVQRIQDLDSKNKIDPFGTQSRKDWWHENEKTPEELRDRAHNFRGPLEETQEMKELERSRESFKRARENSFL